MTWLGPPLDEAQADLVRMIDAFAGDRSAKLVDDPIQVDDLILALVKLGVWTLGTSEAAGGGGADPMTTGVALERIGRYWPALSWASAQAHVAIDILSAMPELAELVHDVHAGRERIAVVDAASPHVRIDVVDAVVNGTIDRVDAAGAAPSVLLLSDASTAVFVPATAFTSQSIRRCGLAGALTRSLQVSSTASQAVEIRGADIGSARTRLWLGAAATAAGICGAAVDAAVQYAQVREQFGGPLIALPTVRQTLLSQASKTSSALMGTLGGVSSPIGALAAVRESCEAAIDVAADAVQVHGGYGYLQEYPVERLLRDAISLRAAVETQYAGNSAATPLFGAFPAKETR